MGKNIVYLTSCHSTNDIAAHKVRSGLAGNGDIVITSEQTSGKGQRGSSWESRIGENLLFSIILEPENLPISNQFSLSQWAALGVCDFVSTIAGPGVSIKWPNDVLIGNQKVSGILIENTIRGNMISYSVVGIGLNVNETGFNNNRRTSLAAATGLTFDLEEILAEILCCLEQRLDLISPDKSLQLKEEYLGKMFGLNEFSDFIAQGETFTGMPTDVTPEGMLVVTTATGQRIFDIKEVAWVL